MINNCLAPGSYTHHAAQEACSSFDKYLLTTKTPHTCICRLIKLWITKKNIAVTSADVPVESCLKKLAIY